MPRPKKSHRLLEKAEAALVAAIEVYNKPASLYREETFSILVLNAWELLLKAKLLSERTEDPRCLFVYEWRRTKNGVRMKKRFLKRNRTGNVHTIGIGRVITELENRSGVNLGVAVKNNLDAIIEIRDNAVHYLNASPELAKLVLAIGTASVINFIELAKTWFERDLSSYNLYLLPIGFVPGPGTVSGFIMSHDEGNLVRYLDKLIKAPAIGEPSNLHVSMDIDVRLRGSKSTAAITAHSTNDPETPAVHLEEKDMLANYSLDYEELTKSLRSRYEDFKVNAQYHEIRKELCQNATYAYPRYLDPNNPTGTKKIFFSPNILNEFDKRYTRN